MRFLILGLVFLTAACSGVGEQSELERWQATADRVTITRDKWGIPHIYGPTDADAVFGMMVAQAEDDFNRVGNEFPHRHGSRGGS